MRSSIQNERYDTKLEASDWRYSAAIVGLLKYLNYHQLQYEVKEDYILYNSEDITEDRYLQFVEYKYSDELHHKKVEALLQKESLTEEEIKFVNEKLTANTVMKTVFNKEKFDNSNKDKILKLIGENRRALIRETYGKKRNGFANYINVNMKAPVEIFKEKNNYCRLVGYTIDAGKKGKSTGFVFDKNTFNGLDEIEFDFIPFAFEGNREAFFINDNFSIQTLEKTSSTFSQLIHNNEENENKNREARQVLFNGIIEAADFIARDVEIILKDIDRGFFETLYIRKENIDILKSLKSEVNYKSLCFSCKVEKNYYLNAKKSGDNYYINVQKEVTNSILNNILLDNLIEFFLKEKNQDYIVKELIKINLLIRGGIVKDRLKGAFRCAKEVSAKLEDNKIDSYRQKLTSSIIFKDYDRVCQILLQLSNYSGVEFGFVYDLFEDFEENKELAYTFINALSKNKVVKEDRGE